MIKDFKHVML